MSLLFVLLWAALGQGAEPPTLAFTIDDLPLFEGAAPGPKEGLEVLRGLMGGKVPGVVAFVTTGAGHRSRALVEDWKRAGYTFGNHTASHLDINSVPASAFLWDIDRNEELLEAISGGAGWKYFRYPFQADGADPETRSLVRGHLAKKGYTIVPATVPIGDPKWIRAYTGCAARSPAMTRRFVKAFVSAVAEAVDEAEAQADALFGRQIPQIILLHPSELVGQALPQILRRLREKGVRFVPVRKALEDDVYRIDPGLIPQRTFFLSSLLQKQGRPAGRITRTDSRALASLEAECAKRAPQRKR